MGHITQPAKPYLSLTIYTLSLCLSLVFTIVHLLFTGILIPVPRYFFRHQISIKQSGICMASLIPITTLSNFYNPSSNKYLESYSNHHPSIPRYLVLIKQGSTSSPPPQILNNHLQCTYVRISMHIIEEVDLNLNLTQSIKPQHIHP